MNSFLFSAAGQSAACYYLSSQSSYILKKCNFWGYLLNFVNAVKYQTSGEPIDPPPLALIKFSE